jgi:CheY-like chemotaxis protein
MPGMDGLALQRQLADDGRAIPIVLITARASEGEERQAFQGGAIAFLRKPVDKDSLVHAIGTCWRRP